LGVELPKDLEQDLSLRKNAPVEAVASS